MIKSVKLIVTMDDGTSTVAELENVSNFQEKFIVPKNPQTVGGMMARRRFVIEGTRPKVAKE